jgi:exopolyphosphatase/guanosine-5'-triphosphate,3'-diphosphate pyrophosphatase
MEATANHIKAITVAAIDLGSNSFRLLIARISDRKILPISKRLVTVRLGQGLCSSDQLNPEAMARGLAALEEFRAEMSHHTIDLYRCCGTAALRKAANASSFLSRAAEILGLAVDILSGEQEALLSSNGALQAITAPPPLPLVVADVGGSSTEMSYLTDPGSPLLTTSIPIGAAAFKELGEKGSAARVKEQLARELTTFVDRARISPGQTTIIATGGTATSLATLDLGLASYDEQKVHGHRLGSKDLDHLAEELGALADNELYCLPGMEPGRGNILPAGLEIYQEIIATIAVDGMIVSDAGLLEGIALSCSDPA